MRARQPSRSNSNPRAARALAVALASLAACRSIGPASVARDRFDYSDSIADSWKRQTLLNIVKLRYLDPPIFVDVGQIVAGYSLETGVSVGVQNFESAASTGDNALFGATGKYTDRPTVTYTPLTGNQFVKALMTPLPPQSVFFTIQSGWPADGVLLASVASINGLKNQETSIAGATPPDPRFLRVIELLRNVQLSGGVSLRVEQDAQKQQVNLLTFRSQDVDEPTLAMTRELRQLLGLDPETTEFQLVFGGTAAHGSEIAVITRSMLHIMTTMAAQVDVPAEDVAQTRATPGLETGGADEQRYRIVRVHSADERPSDAAVAVRYRGHWFWIDDRDLRSKRAFAFMLMLFTLSDTAQKEAPPLITIPAQ